jgi:tungstate transport system substrate-binding protein
MTFVIVGPKNDPANIKEEKDIIGVMQKLSSPNFKFISRDDNQELIKKNYTFGN